MHMSQALNKKMETPMPQLQGIQAIREMLRIASIKELTHHGKLNQIKIAEGSAQPAPIFAPRMALILMVSGEFRITIKVFYSHQYGLELMSQRRRVKIEEVQDAWIPDFMKELMNLTAGATKRSLGSVDVKMGLSLPLIMRGIDDIYEIAHADLQDLDLWTLETNLGTLVYKTSIEIYDRPFVDAIRWSAPVETNEDDMEFL